MAQPGKVGRQQTVVHKVSKWHDALHPQFLTICVEIFQILGDEITHLNRIAHRDMQTLGSIIRENHILTDKRHTLPFVDCRHERIRNSVAVRDDVIDKIGEINNPFVLLYDFMRDEDAVVDERSVRQMNTRPLRLPDIGKLLLVDDIIGEDDIDLALQLHRFGQILPTDEDVQWQSLLVLQQQVATLVHAFYTRDMEPHLRGITLRNKQTAGGNHVVGGEM